MCYLQCLKLTTFSILFATWKIRASLNRGPISCKLIGRPDIDSFIGMLNAGKPA